MRQLIYIFVITQVLKLTFGQTGKGNAEEVHQYVEDIQNFEAQTSNFTFPVNYFSFRPNNSQEGYSNDGDYDFIIIGSGSSGSVLANRLSEVCAWRILLLEAGTWENEITDIPDLTDSLRTTNYNWGFNITSQGKNLAGYLNNAISYPRGKAVGGSSVINAMIYSRGNPADFDKWGLNNPGWNYENVLPYFRKSERVCFPKASPFYHGRHGSLHVEYSRIYDQLGESFLQAQKELQRTVSNDYNGQDPMSFSIVQLNEVFGRRDSGGKAFINPAKHRSNLRILTNTLVTKILINETTKNAYGVEYVRNGSKYYATTKKEIVVSGGSVNTPQILMLSGIGPKSHLQEVGINLIKDLPVGENLWDHNIYNYQSFSINYTYPTENLTTQVEEYLKGKGRLTTADDLQCIGYVNLMNTSKYVPDVEHVFHTTPPGTGDYETYRARLRLTEESYNSVIKPTFNINQIAIHSLLLHPKSRGTITLKSNSPFEFPLLNPNYFSHPEDAETLVAALKDQIRIANTPALQKLNATLIKVCHPSCNCSDFGSDDFLLCMVKALTNTVYHFGGTAKMGPSNDETAVVDAELKVHGIGNLRVADCSVIPVTTSGHTNAVAYMIGEKAADLIKGQYSVFI